MPLMGLRPNRSEKDLLHRRSTFDPSNFFRRSEQVSRSETPVAYLSPQLAQASDESAVSAPPSSHGMLQEPPPSPPIQPATPNTRRFSMLKFRHASDSQLSLRAKEQAATDVPPVPSLPSDAPAIITTAPTIESAKSQPRKPKVRTPFKRRKNPLDQVISERLKPQRSNTQIKYETSASHAQAEADTQMEDVEDPTRLSTTSANFRPGGPASFGADHVSSSVAPSVSRKSESSRSDRSYTGHGAYTSSKNPHSVSATALFRLPGRNKRASLFPLPVKIPPPDSGPDPRPDGLLTPRASTSALTSGSSNESPTLRTPPTTAVPPPSTLKGQSLEFPSARHATSHGALAPSSVSFATPTHPLSRNDSTTSAKSSPPGLLPPMRLERRNRSPTAASSGEVPSTPPLPINGRDSMSLAGRSSLGTVFSLSRFRQSSEAQTSRHGSPASGQVGTPGGTTKSNSFALSREVLALPEREEGETPVKYLARVEETVPRSCIASLLSKSNDAFSLAVIRSYMRTFAFFGDPIDMAVRKLLMEAELPKETQQIDRVIQGFADRYHECNPGIFTASEQAYILAFSIIILQTDVFNKNNKNKMQKTDYIKMASGNDVSDEVLGCFYDNISYTPFIHIDDDVNINGSRPGTHKPRKALFKNPAPEQIKRVAAKEPLDPYTLILESKLDVLRPELKNVINLDDPYTYLGTTLRLDVKALQYSFFRFGVLQILSARSRPEAFMSQAGISNPQGAQAGVVDIMVTKVGILWRKDSKKKKARSPWQEWGAVLTGSQLYLFRTSAWVKGLIHQYELHQRQGNKDTPVVFKPPLTEFKPDAFLSTDDAVALRDATYKRHKHAFTFVRHGGFEENFLADDEIEMNDWLAKLNYASAFRSANVRMKGLVGGSYEGQRNRGIRRLDSSKSVRSVQTPTGEVTIQSGKIDAQLAQQILESRKQHIQEKVALAESQLGEHQKDLDKLLRNARHLQILAPIQPKTRQDIVLAAGRMEAQLRWTRKDIWRVKCHKDVLAKDIEEDVVALEGQPPSTDALTPTADSSLSRPRAQSKSSPLASPVLSPKRSQNSLARSPRQDSRSSLELQTDMAFKARPEPANLVRSPEQWQLPPLSLNPDRHSRGSVASYQASNATHDTRSVASSHRRDAQSPTVSSTTEARQATPTASIDDKEQALLREAGLLHDDLNRPRTAPDSDPDRNSNLPSPEGRSKVRRSLHRTLRDSHGHSHGHHGPSHHRSRKGKDSASSAGLGDDEGSHHENEGLARTKGSFTVHGKKASVIHFGSEWKDMSPEDRLKARREAQAENRRLSVPNAIDDSEDNSMQQSPGDRPRTDVAGGTSATQQPDSPRETVSTATPAQSFIDPDLPPTASPYEAVSEGSIFEAPQPPNLAAPSPRTFSADDLIPPPQLSPETGGFHTPPSRASEAEDEDDDNDYAVVAGEDAEGRSGEARTGGELDMGRLQPQLRAISAES
ncbi:MAG: hypothetical protein M1822_007639 [Bathelium mastoideum]|nr:MAG: hypothetical protein M1822_007639 [Bathelium mastoideum]